MKIETINTINVSNEYLMKVLSNNDALKKIIEENFSYGDLDDIEIFRDFIKDFTRYKTEYDENGAMKLPYRIFLKLDNISFLKPKFIERVKSKYEKKKKELKKYQAK